MMVVSDIVGAKGNEKGRAMGDPALVSLRVMAG
jgi:hypothetical protein